ncbi:MAG: alpha/beta fold hydrolase [Betaproteobacteria bacterium]|nr:alpha/beta fold hydrolase [Betaproteobacteria bacterium]
MESRIPFKPQDNAVLLLHGLAGSSLEVARLGQILQQSGLSVHGPDIPGFAYATPETPWQDWAAFARREYQRLAGEYRTVSVVGVSMGATLALELATHEQVTALVLLSAAMGYDGWATPWYRFLLPVAKLIPFHQRYRLSESEPYGVKNPALRSMVKKMLLERKQSVVGGESISLDQLLQGDALIRQVRSRLDLVNDPLLILHPVEDEAVHPRHAQFVFDNVSSEDKELILLGDCYHMITVDNERDTVYYETDMFIKRCINAKLGKMIFDVPQQLVRSLDRLAKWSQAQGA